MNLHVLVNDNDNELLDTDQLGQVAFYCMVYPIFCFYVVRLKSWAKQGYSIFGYQEFYEYFGTKVNRVKQINFLFINFAIIYTIK